MGWYLVLQAVERLGFGFFVLELLLLLQLYLQLLLAVHFLEVLHLHPQHLGIFTAHPMLLLRHLVEIALNELTFEVIVHLQQHVHILLQLPILHRQRLTLLLIGSHQLLAPRFLIGRHFDTTLLGFDRPRFCLPVLGVL